MVPVHVILDILDKFALISAIAQKIQIAISKLEIAFVLMDIMEQIVNINVHQPTMGETVNYHVIAERMEIATIEMGLVLATQDLQGKIVIKNLIKVFT